MLLVSFIVTAVLNAFANTVSSSTIVFQGTLTDNGDGTYTGIIPCVVGGGFDIFAKEGGTAWFGDDPSTGPVWTSQAIGSDHDAWPTWTPDTPDWYQYSLNLYLSGSQYKWAIRNHPGATAAHPWYDAAYWGSPKPAMGVPMSGIMRWNLAGTGGYAEETDVGAYLPATGTPEIPDGAAGYGGGAQAWDMDWSWGSEAVPLEYPGFKVSITDLGGDTYSVTMTPAAFPVGGLWVSINKTELLAPWITLASLIAIATVSIAYVKRKRQKN